MLLQRWIRYPSCTIHHVMRGSPMQFGDDRGTQERECIWFSTNVGFPRHYIAPSNLQRHFFPSASWRVVDREVLLVCTTVKSRDRGSSARRVLNLTWHRRRSSSPVPRAFGSLTSAPTVHKCWALNWLNSETLARRSQSVVPLPCSGYTGTRVTALRRNLISIQLPLFPNQASPQFLAYK